MLVLADPGTWPPPSTPQHRHHPLRHRAVAQAWDRLHPRLNHRGRLARPPRRAAGHRGHPDPAAGRAPARRPRPETALAVVVATDATAADVDRCWQAFLRRFDLEHTFRLFKQTLGWTSPEAPRPRRRRPLDLAGHRRPHPAAAGPRPRPATCAGPGNDPPARAARPRPASAAGFATSERRPPFRPVRRNPPAPAPAAHPAPQPAPRTPPRRRQDHHTPPYPDRPATDQGLNDKLRVGRGKFVPAAELGAAAPPADDPVGAQNRSRHVGLRHLRPPAKRGLSARWRPTTTLIGRRPPPPPPSPSRLTAPHAGRRVVRRRLRRTWLARTPDGIGKAPSRRRGVRRSARWCSPAATRAGVSPRCASHGSRERSMLGVVQLPAHGAWIKGRPAGSLVPEVRPASSRVDRPFAAEVARAATTSRACSLPFRVVHAGRVSGGAQSLWERSAGKSRIQGTSRTVVSRPRTAHQVRPQDLMDSAAGEAYREQRRVHRRLETMQGEAAAVGASAGGVGGPDAGGVSAGLGPRRAPRGPRRHLSRS